MNEKKKKGLRNVELKLISELMKGSRRSDRELARVFFSIGTRLIDVKSLILSTSITYILLTYGEAL